MSPRSVTVSLVPLPTDLAAKLRRASRRQRDALAERDRLILEAHRAGGTLREIAALVGLSHPSVLNIIQRDE